MHDLYTLFFSLQRQSNKLERSNMKHDLHSFTYDVYPKLHYHT